MGSSGLRRLVVVVVCGCHEGILFVSALVVEVGGGNSSSRWWLW